MLLRIACDRWRGWTYRAGNGTLVGGLALDGEGDAIGGLGLNLEAG